MDPLRPAVFVLVLRTPGALANALAFLIGWASALALIFLLGFFLFNAGAPGRSSATQKTWLSALEMVLAVLLLALAARRWRRRGDTSARPTTPAAVRRQLEHLTPRRSTFLGVLIQPRTLTIAAAFVVARDRSGFISALEGLGVFALLSTGALLGIFTYVVRRPDNAETWLAVIGDRIEQAGPFLFTGACAFGGLYLLVDSVRSLK